MYNEAKEDYVYVIAGAGALEIIQSLKTKADEAKQALADYVAEFGITITLQNDDYTNIEYNLANEDKVPEGWHYKENRAGRYLTPDWDTEEGIKIHGRIESICRKFNIQSEFNQLSHSLAPSVHLNNRKYSFEEVGGQVIIACPRQHEGDAIVPPDSTVISYIDYIKLKEQANPEPLPQTREFENKFTPNN